MQDTPNYVQAGAAAAVLVEAFQITPAQADAALRSVQSEFAWHLERNTLSRRGLADLVQALGSGHHAQSLGSSDIAHDVEVRADGDAILAHILGTEDRSRALAARICRATRLSDPAVTSMLPYWRCWPWRGSPPVRARGWARCSRSCRRSDAGAVAARMPTSPTSYDVAAAAGPTLQPGCGAPCAGPLRALPDFRRAGPCAGMRTSCCAAALQASARHPGAHICRLLAAAGPRGGAAAVVAWPARAAHALGYSRSVAGPAAAVLEGREVAPRPDCRAHGRAPSRTGAGAVVEVVEQAGPAAGPASTSACRPSPFPAQWPSRRPQTSSASARAPAQPETSLHDAPTPHANMLAQI